MMFEFEYLWDCTPYLVLNWEMLLLPEPIYQDTVCDLNINFLYVSLLPTKWVLYCPQRHCEYDSIELIEKCDKLFSVMDNIPVT